MPVLCNSPDNVEDDDEEGGDDEVVGADGPTTPEHDYPGHRSLSHPGRVTPLPSLLLQ